MTKTGSLTNSLTFKQQVLNDLVWLIQSPGLLDDQHPLVLSDTELQSHFSYYKKWLLDLDQHPDQIDASIRHPKPFVGDYFENLVDFCLNNNQNFQKTRRRQTVYSNKRSIGEFDFLFTNEKSKLSYHWEVAVKFYLQHNNRYFGPNAKDRLDIKVHKMLTKQAKLAENPASSALINDYSKPIIAKVILKGMLFYPSHTNWQSCADTEKYISNNHLRGWWSYGHNPVIPKNSKQSRWLLLEKPHWLCSYGAETKTKQLMDYETLMHFITQHFANKQRPLFLAELMQNGSSQYHELSRGFVVSANWPNTD